MHRRVSLVIYWQQQVIITTLLTETTCENFQIKQTLQFMYQRTR